MTDLAFKSVLICNDIRREATGKFIAIGIYGPDIVIPNEEAAVSIACLLQAEIKKPGKFRLEFRIRENQSRDLVKANGEIQILFPSTNSLIDLNVGQQKIRAGTELDFSARQEGQRWRHLSTLAIRGPRQQAELNETIKRLNKENAPSAASTIQP